jgi:hypothetical protein
MTFGFELKCNSSSSSTWGNSLSVYYCTATTVEIGTENDAKITKYVPANHKASYNDDRVNAILIYGLNLESSPIQFMPTNLEKYFDNLEAINIFNSRINSLEQRHFKNYGDKLKYLFFHYSLLESIPGDLFDFNPNLNYLYLAYNNIKHVEPGVFDGLTHLTTLYFNNNPCFSRDATKNRVNVLKVIKEIEAKCVVN